MKHIPSILAFLAASFLTSAALADPPPGWSGEWPDTDFSRAAVPFDEIMSGGPPKDGIPAIDDPRFVPLAEAGLSGREPVIGLVVDGEARAYPLRVLTWHEIVNDRIAGVPVAVTYCPLCNAAIVFDRRVDGRELSFGTTGKLRKSDLVMYDRQTQSWWQQFTGEAIVGEMTGRSLQVLPARLESFDRFAERAPDGLVLVPADPRFRPYGRNPYVFYDSSATPFLFRDELPTDVPPMMRVAAVGDEAWTLDLLRREGTVEHDGLRLEWTEGQASALDTANLAEGRDVGNVVVRRRGPGGWEEVPYDVTFALLFRAFRPGGKIHGADGAD